VSPSVADALATERGLERGQAENAEYPWWHAETDTGRNWVAPADHTFAAFRTVTQRGGDGLRIVALVEHLLTHYDRIP
jgi:hypothetical protein